MRRILATCFSLAVLAANAGTITPLPEKVPPAIGDAQEFEVPDRVHLGGWIGTRISANDTNRLARIDPNRLLEGYRKRPGRQKWDGEHVGKWLHAATLTWANTGDADLRKNLDYVAAELVKCQLDDGYLGTYVPAERWTEWDVWAHKYNLIGLLTYIRYTGNTEPLQACRRMADLLCNTFGDTPGKRDIIPAGQHMGMAPTSVLEPMVLLYRFTGEQRYLDFCKYILRSWEQPNGPKIVSTLLGAKRVDKVGNGKAYEMLSCLNGALEYYRTVGDPRLLEACLNAWDDIVKNRLYITGTASYREFFHDDHDLPNMNNVGETCVTVTWLQFNAQLLRLTGESRFAEQLEKTVLNQLFGAQSLDGWAWGYYVQMQGRKPYNGTLDGHCCLSSGPRGIALIPTFATATDRDGLVVNLFETGTARLALRDGTPVELSTKTSYPKDGQIKIAVYPASPKQFDLKLRIPEWCPEAKVRINGKPASPEKSRAGYTMLRRQWTRGDKVDVCLAMPLRTVEGSHNNEGKIAVLYGPLVLAADEALLDGESLAGLRAASCGLATLHLSTQPAPAQFNSWPGAQAFSIDGAKRGNAQAKPVRIGLVPFADAGASGSIYQVWMPCTDPRPDRNLLIDGIEIRSRKPNAGSIIDGNVETVAATFNNKRASDDWFGVELQEPAEVSRVVFAHGRTYHDGGWFDASAGKPRLQIKTNPDGPWTNLALFENYPATTATNPGELKGGETFEVKLPDAVKVCGVRVVGKPSSGDNPKQAFSTCGELQAFAK